MTIRTAASPEAQTPPCPPRQIGQDFDQNGHHSTLGEMIQMDGFFPVDEIIDRLPFRRPTIWKWAKQGSFASCFKRVQAEGGSGSLLLIHLGQFSSHFEALAEQAREDDSRNGLPGDRAWDDISGLEELAELLLGAKQL